MSGPAPAPRPLGGRFFQLGYVARDLDRALATFAERYGVPRFQHYMSREDIDVALAYQGDTMIEVIVPHGDDHPLYGEAKARGDLVLHHLGYLVDDEEWGRLPEQLAELGLRIAVRSPQTSPVGFIYADARAELGHYVEYVHLPPGRDVFAQVPRN